VAFIIVAALCAFVVGRAVRAEAVRQLVAHGVPTAVIAPLAPDLILSADQGTGARDLPARAHAMVTLARAGVSAPTAAPAEDVSIDNVVDRPAVSRTVRHPRTASKKHAPQPAKNAAPKGATPKPSDPQAGSGTVTTPVQASTGKGAVANLTDAVKHDTKHHASKHHASKHHASKHQATKHQATRQVSSRQTTRQQARQVTSHQTKSQHHAKKQHAQKHHHTKKHQTKKHHGGHRHGH
jgi:hypothetical protein